MFWKRSLFWKMKNAHSPFWKCALHLSKLPFEVPYKGGEMCRSIIELWTCEWLCSELPNSSSASTDLQNRMRFTMSTGEKISTADTPVIIEQPEVLLLLIRFFYYFRNTKKSMYFELESCCTVILTTVILRLCFYRDNGETSFNIFAVASVMGRAIQKLTLIR